MDILIIFSTDETLVKLPKDNGEELKKLSYETKLMKELGDNKYIGRVLELN